MSEDIKSLKHDFAARIEMLNNMEISKKLFEKELVDIFGKILMLLPNPNFGKIKSYFTQEELEKIDYLLNQSFPLVKLEESPQSKIYAEEREKAANAIWILADYLVEYPQDYLSEPWTLLPQEVRETIEYVVNRKKVVEANLNLDRRRAVPLDMSKIQEDIEFLRLQEHNEKLKERTNFYNRVRREIDSKPEPND